MPVDRIEYMDRFLDAVDRVTAGRPGGITEDRCVPGMSWT